MSFRVHLPSALAVAVVALGAAGCGQSNPGLGIDAGVDAAPPPDARVPDARIWDARPDAADARVWPDARLDTGWCGENPFPGVDPNAQPLTSDPPMWMSPILSADGTGIAYSHDRSPSEPNGDVFLFDISTWTETRVTEPVGSDQIHPCMHGLEIVYSDDQFETGPGDNRVDLMLRDVRTGVTTRLTDSPNMKISLAYNGRYVLYDFFPLGTTVPELRLLDLQTSGDIVLSEADRNHEGVSMNERYVTWVAIPPWRPTWTSNKDVYIHDLETGDTTHLDSTTDHLAFHTSVSGSRVAWEDIRNEQWEIYLYDIQTGVETRLTNDPFDQCVPRLCGNLVTFVDYRFTLGWQGNECARHIAILDLDTMVMRRVTSLPWFWYGIPLEGGWLLGALFDLAGPGTSSKLYLFDLVSMGILDASGDHVLPGP